MIVLEELSKSYGATTVLDDICLALPAGGVTAIIGPNGAGKSTLLSIIGRILKADRGRVMLEDMDMATAPGNQVARRLAVLRQDNAPAARLTVHDLVTFGRYPHSRGRPTSDDMKHVAHALAYLGLDELADRFLDELSGGQRQRAFIAMVLAQDTDYILLDEPLNNLDIRHAVAIMRLIRDAARDLGKTVVVVMHDINMAAACCDRIIVMKEGRVIRHGPPPAIMAGDFLSQVYATPITVHEIAGRLIAVY